MPAPNRTTKQIAEKYKGNLDYFHKGHFFRRLRLICFIIAVVGSIAAVLTFRYWGKEQYLSTGPICANHAQFANNCQVCHEGVDSDLLTALPFGKIGGGFEEMKKISVEKITAKAGEMKLPSLDAVKSSTDQLTAALSKEKLTGLLEQGVGLTRIERMDRACLKCHNAMHLHQPQAEALRLRSALREISL